MHADADDPAVTAIPLSGVSVMAKDRTERVDRRLPEIRLRPRRTHHERQLQCEPSPATATDRHLVADRLPERGLLHDADMTTSKT